MTDMAVVMEIMNSLGSLQTTEELEIKELNVVLGQQDDGVLLKVSSPDKDGVKLAEMLGELFTKLPKIIQMQSPDIIVNYTNRDLRTKKSAE
jgi:hypothetical protein